MVGAPQPASKAGAASDRPSADAAVIVAGMPQRPGALIAAAIEQFDAGDRDGRLRRHNDGLRNNG